MTYRQMSRRFTAIVLVLVFFLFSLNAYACLIPVFGPEAMTGSGMTCTLPHEQSAKHFCDGFKHLIHAWESDDPGASSLKFCATSLTPEDLNVIRFPETQSIEARAQSPPVLPVPLYTLHRSLLI